MIERRENTGLALCELDVLPSLRATNIEPLDRDGTRTTLTLLPIQTRVGDALRALAERAFDSIATVAQRRVHTKKSNL
jgi:hypothetical protein